MNIRVLVCFLTCVATATAISVHAQALDTKPNDQNVSAMTNGVAAQTTIITQDKNTVGAETGNNPDSAVRPRSHIGAQDPPLGVEITHRHDLFGGEAIRSGMVWAPGKDEAGRAEWHQKAIGSCEWCGKPMTWKKAAFDKHALLWMAVPIGLGIADTEYTFSRPCMKDGTCREGNPLLGSTRAQQYGIRFALYGGMWLGNSWLRKGDLRINEGGLKHWYLIPVEYGSFSAVAIILNAVSVHKK